MRWPYESDREPYNNAYENEISASTEAERFMLELITSLSSTELIDDGINNVLCKVGDIHAQTVPMYLAINEDYTTAIMNGVKKG